MEIRCINNVGKGEYLTLYKSYKVIEKDSGCYYIKNDKGMKFGYSKDRFIIVEGVNSKIPIEEKYVKCIDGDTHGWIELRTGDIYKVLFETDYEYYVENNSRRRKGYPKDRFEKVPTSKTKWTKELYSKIKSVIEDVITDKNEEYLRQLQQAIQDKMEEIEQSMKEIRKEEEREMGNIIEERIKEMEKLVNKQNEEISKLKEELAKQQQEENKKKWWTPKNGEKYYYIDSENKLYGEINTNHEIDTLRINTNNCFKTKEEVERELFERQLRFKLKKFAYENNEEEIDWNNENQRKYGVIYDYKIEEVQFSVCSYCPEYNQIYFTSPEVIKKAIETFKDDLIRYFASDK